MKRTQYKKFKILKRRTNTFDFASKDQREYYEKASELGIGIKFIFVKILDGIVNEIKMCDYPKDLTIFKRKVRPKRVSEPPLSILMIINLETK